MYLEYRLSAEKGKVFVGLGGNVPATINLNFQFELWIQTSPLCLLIHLNKRKSICPKCFRSYPSRLSICTTNIVTKRGIFVFKVQKFKGPRKCPGRVDRCWWCILQCVAVATFELELLHPARRTQWAPCVMVRPQEGGNRTMVRGLNRTHGWGLVSNCNHGLRATDSRKASLHFIFMVHPMGLMCHG